RAEAALRQSEANYLTLIEQSHYGVYIHSTGGFEFVNQRVLEITGYSEEELLGMDMSALLHPEDRELVMQIAGERSRGIPSQPTFGARVVRKDGKARYCEFSVASIPHGEGSAELGSIRDVTLRRQIEEDLKEHAKALERSNKELEQFAYVASHDLQEPLRMVASYVQLLEKRYKGRLDKDADEFIEFAVDGAKRMQVLINDLLQYSRVNTRGKEFQPTELEDVMVKTVANLKIAIEEAGATVTHDALPRVSGDAGQLLQVMQNLVGNAIKFRGKAPPVIHISATRRERDHLVSVRDNGIGIDMQYKERIFVIFQRLHKRDEYPGTGIGLAVCKRIVERHGGEIWVESRPGEGATFYFTIPIRGGE
ncbi:MAG: ATP-binding protein, partial [Thermoplasmata archaeon]|nr:ATP-binding protein [Thermoplasmata archaeon]